MIYASSIAQVCVLISSAAYMYTAFWLILKGVTNYSSRRTPLARAQSRIESLGSRELQCRELEAVLINTSDSGARQGTAVMAQTHR